MRKWRLSCRLSATRKTMRTLTFHTVRNYLVQAGQHSVHPGSVRRGHDGGTRRAKKEYTVLKPILSKWRYLVPPS